MSYNIDLSGTDIICNSISTGASTSGTAGTAAGALSDKALISVVKKGIDMNSATTDTTIAITLPTGITTYKVHSVEVWGANHTLITATAGLFTAASGGGVAIVSNGAVNNTSGTDATALNTQSLTLASATTSFTATTLYFRVGTAEGAAATANVTITLRILG